MDAPGLWEQAEAHLAEWGSRPGGAPVTGASPLLSASSAPPGAWPEGSQQPLSDFCSKNNRTGLFIH